MKAEENNSQEEILDTLISQLVDSDERAEVPEHAQDVDPLLEVARQVREAYPTHPPRKIFAHNSRMRVLNRLQARQTSPVPSRGRKPGMRSWIFRPARAMVTLFLAFMLMITSTGVAMASSDAIPGDALYPVKRGMEEIRLGFTFSENGDAELLNAFTTERMDEIEALILEGRDEYLEDALDDYEETLDRLIDQVVVLSQSEGENSLNEFSFNFAHQMGILERVRANAPEDIQAKMEETKERAQHGQDVVEYIRHGGNPSDLAPGQQKKQTPQSETGNQGNGPKETKTPKPKERKTPGPPPWANPGGQDKD
jgi:hypothetical protein